MLWMKNAFKVLKYIIYPTMYSLVFLTDLRQYEIACTFRYLMAIKSLL